MAGPTRSSEYRIPQPDPFLRLAIRIVTPSVLLNPDEDAEK